MIVTPPNEPKTGIILEECAYRCKGISTMFIFGTNEYGHEQCWGKKCACICETGAYYDGTCKQIGQDGFLLFKYAYKGKSVVCRIITHSANYY